MAPVQARWSCAVVARIIGMVAITTISFTGTAQALPPSQSNTTTITTAYGTELTIDPERFHVYDIPMDRFESITGIPAEYQTKEPRLGDRAAVKTPAAIGRVLTLLIEWEEHAADPSNHTPGEYDAMLYSTNTYPTGSVQDYYQEVSYGTYGISGDVYGWYNLVTPYNGWYDINEIVAAVDPTVNFADYDADGDGFVDALWLIHAGPGQEETHNTNDIWSHAYLGMDIPTADGVSLARWSVQPEAYANGDIIAISVFCHEYAHILGMTDLYDYDDRLDTVTFFTYGDTNDHPLVDWDIMGYGGYNVMSYGTRACPRHFSAWSRTFLGWASPEIPACLDGTYQLYNVEEYSAQNVFRVPITDDGTEYFLLEYRNPHSAAKFDHLNSDFSAYFPWFTPGPDTLDAGLLVTHIDETVTPNGGYPHEPNYAVMVVDAGYDPANPWDGVSEYSEWWYPYEFRIGALYSPEDPGQTTLSPTTTPSSAGYHGPSNVTISVLAQNNDYLTLQISKPYPPAFDPVAPVAMVELETIDIPVSATDENCTIPALSLTNSPPAYAALVDYGDGTGLLTLTPGLGDAGPEVVSIQATDGALDATLNVIVDVSPACVCPLQGDGDADGFITSIDLGLMIDALFAGGDNPQDPNCTTLRFDFFDCDGFTTSLDLSAIIDHMYAGGAGPCDPCAL